MYNTPMSERINIWGKAGCELPNGKLCTACCVLPEVELEGTIVSVKKPAFSPCPNLKRAEEGQGCNLHQNGKGDICKNWHCSGLGNNYRVDLIAGALSLGSVTESEAILAVKQLQGVEYLETDMIERSKSYSTKIHNMELVGGDLDEP